MGELAAAGFGALVLAGMMYGIRRAIVWAYRGSET